MAQKQNSLPSSWSEEEELRQIAEFYDSLTEEERIAHDEYAYENPYTVDVLVPKALLSTVRDMIARHEADNPEATAAAQAWLDRKSDGPGNFPPGWNSERRMQPEQYFKDGKQRFGLDRSTVTTTHRLQRLLVGLLLACCLLILLGIRVSSAFRRQVCSRGKLGILHLEYEFYLATPDPPYHFFPIQRHQTGYA